MIFWLIIATLAVITAFLLYLPDYAGRGNALPGNEEDRSFYERRLLDINADLQDGRLNDDDAEALRTEAARKLIQASNEKSPGTSTKSVPNAVVYIALVFVPVFSVLVYMQLGRPEYALSQQISEADVSLETMIKAAETRLKNEPNEVEGWQVLAPVYVRLGRYNDAVKAYQNLVRLSGRKPELLFSLGEAMVLENEHTVPEQAAALFSEVLRTEPQHPGASYYSGLSSIQTGDEKQAIAIWIALLERSHGSEPWVASTVQNLKSLGVADEKLEKLVPGFAVASQLQALSPEERAQQIEGMVASLAAKLEADPNDRDGWLRLVRSQIVLRKFDQAAKSAQIAKAVFPDDESFVTAIESMLKQVNSKSTGSEN